MAFFKFFNHQEYLNYAENSDNLEHFVDCGIIPIMLGFLKQSGDEVLKKHAIDFFWSFSACWRSDVFAKKTELQKKCLHSFFVENKGLSVILETFLGLPDPSNTYSVEEGIHDTLNFQHLLNNLMETTLTISKHVPNTKFMFSIRMSVLDQLLTDIDGYEKDIPLFHDLMSLGLCKKWRNQSFALLCEIVMKMPQKMIWEMKDSLKHHIITGISLSSAQSEFFLLIAFHCFQISNKG